MDSVTASGLNKSILLTLPHFRSRWGSNLIESGDFCYQAVLSPSIVVFAAPLGTIEFSICFSFSKLSALYRIPFVRLSKDFLPKSNGHRFGFTSLRNMPVILIAGILYMMLAYTRDELSYPITQSGLSTENKISAAIFCSASLTSRLELC